MNHAVRLRAQQVALGVVVATLCACSATPAATTPTITVEPRAALMDQPVAIRVSGLPADQRASIQLTSTDGLPTTWTSHAEYVADARGDLDVTTASASDGTYQGRLGMGLVSSMLPDASPAAYRWPKTPATFMVKVTTTNGQSATTTMTRSLARPGDTIDYTQLSVEHNGFYGFYATTVAAKTRRHPAVLLLGGSEGGNYQQVTAAAFTLHGVSALSLAYFKEDGLPNTLSKIPLEYFEHALTWLGQQPGVDPNLMWVIGTSRGSEAAQLLGVHDPGLVHGVIAGSPSNVTNCSYPSGAKPCVGAAWYLNNKPLPYTADFNNPVPSDNSEAIIPVERIQGPVIVVCGGADRVWRSCLLGQAIIDRRKGHHLDMGDHLYRYPDAGHGVGGLLPYQPATPRAELDGSSPTADAAALADVWPKVIAAVTAVPASTSHH